MSLLAVTAINSSMSDGADHKIGPPYGSSRAHTTICRVSFNNCSKLHRGKGLSELALCEKHHNLWGHADTAEIPQAGLPNRAQVYRSHAKRISPMPPLAAANNARAV